MDSSAESLSLKLRATTQNFMMKVLFVISESQAITPSPETPAQTIPMTADRRQRLLVVDGLAETEEVLRAIFEPRGMEIDHVKAKSNDSSCETQDANVIVLHEETTGQPVTGRHSSDVPRVIIGRMERTQPTRRAEASAASSSERFLAEPFHYGELVQAIEDLLADGEASDARAA